MNPVRVLSARDSLHAAFPQRDGREGETSLIQRRVVETSGNGPWLLRSAIRSWTMITPHELSAWVSSADRRSADRALNSMRSTDVSTLPKPAAANAVQLQGDGVHPIPRLLLVLGAHLGKGN